MSDALFDIQAVNTFSPTVDRLPPLRVSLDDHRRGILLMEALVPGCCEMRSVVIDGAPHSKTRARFTKGGKAYKTKEDRSAEERTAALLKEGIGDPKSGNLALVCIFYRPNRQRIDADNMLKHICDAANGVLWIDDSQVTAISGVVELDIERPRTVVVVARHVSTLVRDRGVILYCEQCGKPFTKGSSPQTLCSRACQIAAQKIRNVSRATKTKTPCSGCGGPTSKAGVDRCRACWASRGSAGLPITNIGATL